MVNIKYPFKLLDIFKLFSPVNLHHGTKPDRNSVRTLLTILDLADIPNHNLTNRYLFCFSQSNDRKYMIMINFFLQPSKLFFLSPVVERCYQNNYYNSTKNGSSLYPPDVPVTLYKSRIELGQTITSILIHHSQKLPSGAH